MEAHSLYWNGRHTESLVTYMLLAELGYEVAQSNAAFILDRHDVEILSQEESYSRALMYWGRAASQVRRGGGAAARSAPSASLHCPPKSPFEAPHITFNLTSTH